ncbi:hypothetical protein CAPTEDRAFT_220788 [Capitella teleta]|uniref:PH domain-containing protein n=1 Tax=Capitella teleta TaxID=283909 RepID=R7TI95_CAPTE|nr:hypothetical protein CAPTEDRAFT_220788 [Capitella teleta]|eukprot:ELT93449.1 hypothetical protein CAPTEDRAFT_220788 [Capitella teleta]
MTLGSEFDRENQPPTSSLMQEEDDAVASGCPTLLGGDVDALPRKTGSVTMLQALPGSCRKVQVSVVLKVYATSYGRYAVVAQDRELSKDCGYIKLRNCTVRPMAFSPEPAKEARRGLSMRTANQTNSSKSRLPGFEIIAKRGEGESLQFYVKDNKQLADWLAVLVETESSPCRLRCISEPTLISHPKLDTTPRRPRSLSSPKSTLGCLSEELEE